MVLIAFHFEVFLYKRNKISHFVVQHHSAVGHVQDQVVAVGAVAIAAHPLRAVAGLGMWVEVEVEQRVDIGVDDEDDVTAAAAVAAVRSAERFELLTMDRRTTVAALARADVQNDAVDESGHGTDPPRVDAAGVGESGTNWWTKRSGADRVLDPGPPLIGGATKRGGLGLHRLRHDVDGLAAALAAELDRTRREREQGVVAATADVDAGVEVGAALANQDLTGADGLAAEALDAEALCIRIATVA